MASLRTVQKITISSLFLTAACLTLFIFASPKSQAKMDAGLWKMPTITFCTAPDYKHSVAISNDCLKGVGFGCKDNGCPEGTTEGKGF